MTDKKSITFKGIIIPFLIGGFTVATVKTVGQISGPALAAIAAACTSWAMASTYFIADEETYAYAINYFLHYNDIRNSYLNFLYFTLLH